jgi:hypothetical protein
MRVRHWGIVLVVALGLLAGVVSADIANSTGKLGPVLGGGSSGAAFTGGVLDTATSLNDDLCFTLGSSDTAADPCIRHDTTQTVDTGMLLTGTTSNHWVMAERQDETFDFAHAQTTDPTLFLHSRNQSTTQWLGLTHNGTNGVIGTGVGSVAFTVPINGPAGNAAAPGITLTTASSGFFANGNYVAVSDQGTAVAFMSSSFFSLGTNIPFAFDTANGPYMSRHASTVVRFGSSSTAIAGFQGGGAAVASATAMPVPTGRVFHVTGTTTITSITSTNFASGACVTLIFDGVLTFTDGNNLALAGNFVTTADDTISLCYDGTNWYETGRAVI